jgi:hypothetical protein
MPIEILQQVGRALRTAFTCSTYAHASEDDLKTSTMCMVCSAVAGGCGKEVQRTSSIIGHAYRR